MGYIGGDVMCQTMEAGRDVPDENINAVLTDSLPDVYSPLIDCPT